MEVSKEGGAIGVRIAGGTDKPHSRGLVYIKCLTANTAASRSGALQEGDIVLQVYIIARSSVAINTCTCCALGKWS